LKRTSKYILTVFALLAPLLGLTQQDPLYSQYFNNPVSINPAYAGSRGSMNMMLLHRRQWIGIDGAPVTSTISLNRPGGKKNEIGYGFSYIHDDIGPINQNGVYADYSYTVNLNWNIKLALGLKGGFNYYKFDLNTLNVTHPEDPLIVNGQKKLFLPNFGVGTYIYTEKYAVGFSVPKLLRNSLSEEENTLEQLNREERHYFLTASALFNISEGIRFRPSFITRIVKNAPASLDLNAQFIFADKFWAGLLYRVNDSFGANVQFQVSKSLKVGYSYDLSSSWMRPYNSGTHEISLNFDFPLGEEKALSEVKFF